MEHNEKEEWHLGKNISRGGERQKAELFPESKEQDIYVSLWGRKDLITQMPN